MSTAKLLKLDRSWLQQLQENFANGALGRFLAARTNFEGGSLAAWVPESVDELPSRNLRHSLVGLEESIGAWPAVCDLFDKHLCRDPHRLIIAGTYGTLGDSYVDRMEANWFSTDPTPNSDNVPVCAYLTGEESDQESYDRLINESSPYPRTIILTSTRHGRTIHPKQHLAADSDLLDELIRELEHVLIGVFDDTSFMIWSRAPNRAIKL